MRATLSVVVCLAVLDCAAFVHAQEGTAAADDLLAEGYRLYSEDLEFDRAAEAFEQVAAMPGATDSQRLEALEYLTACRYALDDQEGARSAIEQMLRIDPEGTLHDPSLPPDLLDLVEQVRASMPPLPPETPEPPDVEAPPGLRDLAPDEGPGEGGPVDEGSGLEEYYPDRPTTPWYRTWWFWTIAGAVVVAGVTTAIVLAVPGGEAEPPAGSLDPGRVQLPCAGIPF